jgi:hypothetical protein
MVFKKIKLAFGLILLTLISTSGIAQTASAVFESDNAFQLTINNRLQQEVYAKSFIISKLPGERPYSIKIEFKADTVILKQNIYLIAEGLAHIYQISKKKLQLKKVIPSASYIKPENQFAFVYLENAEFSIDTVITDTLQTKDTAYVVPFSNSYQLKDYEGRIGCPFPIKEEQQSELKRLIMVENLEESKLEKVKNAIQDMDSACVLIDQIKDLALLFEYEETKVDFVKFMLFYAFDIDNVSKLANVFSFENSLEEIKQEMSIQIEKENQLKLKDP